MSFRNTDAGREGRHPAALPAAAMGLVRQSSIYSLTLDEFQHTLGGLGKDFGSMNMDEFLKNIWIAEETQAMASAVGFGDASVGGGLGLQRQASLTLPRTISLKTVHEVWRDIEKADNCDAGGGQWSNLPPQQPQATTYGEMTLEEFLLKAGVVREDTGQCSRADGELFGAYSSGGANDAERFELGYPPVFQTNGVNEVGLGLKNHGLELPYEAKAQLGNGATNGGTGGIGEDVVVTAGVGFVEGGSRALAAVGSPASNGELSPLSPPPPPPCLFIKGQGRKPGSIEKAVERRQKRMIKNRESAARSRARKQAYTMELEAEVAKLKEKNQELMIKQAKIFEMQQQALESREKEERTRKRKLRRTLTGPW